MAILSGLVATAVGMMVALVAGRALLAGVLTAAFGRMAGPQ